MDSFDFPKLITYYTKVVASCLKSGGRDWRYDMYQERLNRVIALSTKPNLTREDRQYLTARSAVAAAF